MWLTSLAIIGELNLRTGCLIGGREKGGERRVLSRLSPPFPSLECLRELARILVFSWFQEVCLFFIAEFSLLFIRTGLRLKHQSNITSLTFYRYNLK